MGSKARQIPLAEFRKMITRIPSGELAKMPPETLPDNIPLDLIQNAPPDIAATIETLIFQRQSSVMHNLNRLRDSLGADATEAYDMASLPRITPAIRTLLEKLREIQRRLRDDNQDETPLSPQEALEALEALGGIANDVGDYYHKLLAARKSLRGVRHRRDDELLAFLKKIDGKLRRRCALHRNVLDQYHSQKLLATVQVMRDYRDRIQAHADELSAHSARRQQLEQRLLDAERKVRRFPANSGFRHLAERLRDELDALIKGQRPLPIPLGEEELELWLDVIVDHRLLRGERQSMARLQQRAESLYIFLLRHYYRLQSPKREDATPSGPRRGNGEREPEYTEHARRFLIDYFRSRQRNGVTPYWVPEIYRLEKLRKLEEELIEQ